MNPWCTPGRGQRKQEGDSNVTCPKFLMLSPTLTHYKGNPIPKSSGCGMSPEKEMGLLGSSDLTQLDYPINYIVPTATVFHPLRGHTEAAVALNTSLEAHRSPTAFAISISSHSPKECHRLHTSGCQAHRQSEQDCLPGNLASPVPKRRRYTLFHSTEMLPLPASS